MGRKDGGGRGIFIFISVSFYIFSPNLMRIFDFSNVKIRLQKCRYHAKLWKISSGVHVRNANMQNGRLNRIVPS